MLSRNTGRRSIEFKALAVTIAFLGVSYLHALSSRSHAANYSREGLCPEVQRTALLGLPGIHIVVSSRDIPTHVIKTGGDILWRYAH